MRDSAFGVPVFVLANGKASVEQEGDRESFRILRHNVRFLDVDNSPKTVVVTSALPDEGKSTGPFVKRWFTIFRRMGHGEPTDGMAAG